MRTRALIGTAVLTVLVVGLVVTSPNPVAPVAQAKIVKAKASDCTVIGTPDRDILAGGPGRQVICTKGAGDYGHGRGGNDVLRGGGKNDTLIGGKGADHVEGKGGPDQLFAVDGVRGNDVVKGGNGSDHCYTDPGDKVKGCEVVHRGASPQQAQAMTSQFGGVMVLAEEQIATPPPTPTPTPTVIVPPVSPTPPNCTPPPASPPPGC